MFKVASVGVVFFVFVGIATSNAFAQNSMTTQMYETATKSSVPVPPAVRSNQPGASQSSRMMFQQKLQKIQNTQKQQLLTNIDSRLNAANINQTQQWTTALQKLSTILNKITQQSTTLKAQGKNTTTLEAAIANAQTAITNAQTTVSIQSQKEYMINVTSEATLRVNTLSTLNQFKNDMKVTMQSVVTARNAVAKAAEELIKAQLPETTTPATNSGNMIQ